MVHAAEQMIRIADDLVTALAFDMGHETNAAAVVFKLRVI
jgi:hypothetical protein